MKKIILVCFSLLALGAVTQGKKSQQSNLAPLLPLYYDIKNALVASDGNVASAKASAFVKLLNGVDVKTLSSAEAKVYTSLKDKLLKDAEHIANTKEVEHQRDHMADFSNNMYQLVKAAKLSSTAVYRMYCPMKKTYWLSEESSIKNPYYGKSMLNCGKVTETIQ
ncbi:MAG: DUF3347 domain-containing protein [Bacteroidota bacterium]